MILVPLFYLTFLKAKSPLVVPERQTGGTRGKRDRNRNAGGKKEKSNPFGAVKPEIAGNDQSFHARG